MYLRNIQRAGMQQASIYCDSGMMQGDRDCVIYSGGFCLGCLGGWVVFEPPTVSHTTAVCLVMSSTTHVCSCKAEGSARHTVALTVLNTPTYWW